MNIDIERESEVRRREIEEALEVKSLKRIISAFLNYPEAADEDVKRYERSYTRLSPAHKALLSNLPDKYKKLRRCISKNSFFIFSMLQAFEPPFDMSEDRDCCEDQDLENIPDGDTSCRTNDCSHKSESPNGRLTVQKLDEASCGGATDSLSRCPDILIVSQEDKSIGSNGSDCGRCFSSSQQNGNSNRNGHNELKHVHCQSPERSATHSDSNVLSPPDWLDPSLQLHVPLVDVDKVRCIIRNIVRDWAAEGKMEREQCYKPILEELEIQFPNRQRERPPACLVPGAGLGRLALEISTLGFISQGNEFSYYMMICSNFILNQAQAADEWTIYPWIHSNCNSLSDDDQLRPVPIPDIHPASAGITEGFSMCGGDFIEVYSDPTQVGAWDVVVTCFFIDTAHNVVEYIEVISRILRDGGVWINLGPLLYHFAEVYGQDEDMSIELSLEDVKRVAYHYGFELEKEKIIETTYTTNCRSMMQNRYNAAFWTMRKKTVAVINMAPCFGQGDR